MIDVIADPGSCWNNKKDYGFQLIQAAKDAGCVAIKFQLFGKELAQNGNLELSFDMFRDFYHYGKDKKIPVTASVFTYQALEEIFKYQVPFIKFGYSQKHQKEWIMACLTTGRKVMVSCDVMTDGFIPTSDLLTKLYCIPEYPVRYKVDFEGLFPRFNGFSDHTLGWKQTLEAANCGAKTIEKHLTLPYSDINCPDSKFALKPNEFSRMVKELNP